MASASMGYHSKKVILYNVNGFWNGLLTFMDELQGQGFARRPMEKFYGVANSFDELIDLLK
jgi:predicted Rossmann-fold nucleotide-binding protein